jgi:L-lactate dehydrogenase complex protein LldG
MRFGANGSGKRLVLSDDPKMSSRNEMLRRIRNRLGVRGDEPGRRGLVQSRLRNPKANIVPERAQRPKAELIKMFQTMLENCGTKVVRLRSMKALPEALAAALRESNLPSRLRAGADHIFDDLRAEPGLLEILPGAAAAEDTASLSRAFAGAAESGTLFLLSGPDNPSTLNFLPATHIAVIHTSDICGSYEEAWTRVRSAYAGTLPRTINLIGGPSRTGDIEQTLVMGAHGPKNLIVLIVSG